MLLVTNEEIETFLEMPECIARLEEAYRDFGNQDAVDIPRQDMLVSNRREGAVHSFKTMSGSWPRAGVAALRLNSDVVNWPVHNGSVLLFSTDTGQLLCMFNDGVVQKTRVGGSSGVAAKYLSRKNAKVMGLLGTGWQAEAHLEAMCAVRSFDLVKVYSPTPENRRNFVERYRKKLNVNIQAVNSDHDAADGADILVSATNSMTPTIRTEWIRPGMHITSVRGSEIPLEVLSKVDRLVVNTSEPVAAYPARGWPSQVPEFANGDYSRPDIGVFDLSTVPELKDVVAGKAAGRSSDSEITCFHNYKGLGLQFAALGSIVYDQAKQRKLGLAIEDRYFTQSVHP
jgi:ornithine cyclodeaminase/alanine dehydrogenase-like protein (mu-crystallin family)